MSKHQFTVDETLRGVHASVLSRRDQSKLIKKLAKMDFDKATVEKLIEVFKVLVSSPPGLFLTGSLIIDALEALGYFGSTKMTSSGSSQGSSFDQIFKGIFTSFPGVPQFLEVVQSQLPGGTSNNVIPIGRLNAGYLQAGLFTICTIQALGGGQGISTLATAAISALK